jgi:hypothetical protein
MLGLGCSQVALLEFGMLLVLVPNGAAEGGRCAATTVRLIAVHRSVADFVFRRHLVLYRFFKVTRIYLKQ